MTISGPGLANKRSANAGTTHPFAFTSPSGRTSGEHVPDDTLAVAHLELREAGPMDLPARTAPLRSITTPLALRGGHVPLRVLHVYKTFYPDSIGGMEQAISQMVRSTQTLGVQNRILSLSAKPTLGVLHWNGAEHYRFHETVSLASNAMSLELFAAFGKHVQWADVVHYHFPWPFGDLLHLLRQVKKPSLVTYHSDIVRQRHWMKFYRPLMHRFLGSVDRIIATSPNYVRTSGVLQRYGDKTTVIPIGLNDASYPVVPDHVVERWRAAAPRGGAPARDRRSAGGMFARSS